MLKTFARHRNCTRHRWVGGPVCPRPPGRKEGGTHAPPSQRPPRSTNAPAPHQDYVAHTVHKACLLYLGYKYLILLEYTLQNAQISGKHSQDVFFPTKIIDSIIDNISINADIQHCLGKHPCKSRSVYLGIAQITVLMVHKCPKASWQVLTPSLTKANVHLDFNFHCKCPKPPWQEFRPPVN